MKKNIDSPEHKIKIFYNCLRKKIDLKIFEVYVINSLSQIFSKVSDNVFW